jgi:coenzyme F420-0:L-glutamate ligase / coenzyme F420-1:gamma-L-glutamate ligase
LIQQQKQLLESLYNSKIARLATVDPENNQPYVIPVVFAFDGNNIFIPIDDKPKTVNSNQLKRVKNIQKNPNISFLIDTYDDKDWNNLSYLMIQGKARIINMINDKDNINKAHSLLSDKYLQYKNTVVGMGDKCIVIDIQKTITWKY